MTSASDRRTVRWRAIRHNAGVTVTVLAKGSLTMEALEIDVANESGLHARPAAAFVKMAASFQSEITVENLTRGSTAANAKSLLAVLGCGVEQGHKIRVSAQGEDEKIAIEGIRALAESGFGETTQA